MTALGKLLRTTAFQLTLVYLFGLCAVLAGDTAGLLRAQYAPAHQRADHPDRRYRRGHSFQRDQYNEAGIRGLVLFIDVRSRRPGSSLYLVTTPNGEGLAGNVGSLEPGVLDHPGWLETSYRRIEATDDVEHRALVQVVELPGGFRWRRSAAIWRNANVSTASFPMPDAGRSRWWSCSGSPVDSLSAGACSSGSTP